MSEQMRKEFEAVARNKWQQPLTIVDGKYWNISTRCRWEAWQAALATQPQAPQGGEAERLREALVCTREALERANTMKGGPIIDTIWYDASETLFDYIDSVVAPTETPEAGK